VPIYCLILARELPKKLFPILAVVLVFVSGLNLGSRLMANAKFIPYILGKESERSFMKKNLNFAAGNFYDLDGQIGKITKGSKVLVDGIHNQYYLNINYSDITDIHRDDTFSYVLAGDGAGEKYRNLPLVYKNRISKVSLYKARISF
jgi:hypothetical protein